MATLGKHFINLDYLSTCSMATSSNIAEWEPFKFYIPSAYKFWRHPAASSFTSFQALIVINDAQKVVSCYSSVQEEGKQGWELAKWEERSSALLQEWQHRRESSDNENRSGSGGGRRARLAGREQIRRRVVWQHLLQMGLGRMMMICRQVCLQDSADLPGSSLVDTELRKVNIDRRKKASWMIIQQFHEHS